MSIPTPAPAPPLPIPRGIPWTIEQLEYILTKDDSLPLPRQVPPPPNHPPIKTQKRAATILPNFVGLKFAVHNGKTYHEVVITEEMVGRKLGEYVPYVYLGDDMGIGMEEKADWL